MPAGWPAFTSAAGGYSIRYPAGWYDLSNFGAPEDYKYFANEDVGAPLELHESGIWLTIRSPAAAYTPPTPGPFTSVDGRRVVATAYGPVTIIYGVSAPPGAEWFAFANAAVQLPGRTVTFSFGSPVAATLRAALDTIALVVASIRAA